MLWKGGEGLSQSGGSDVAIDSRFSKLKWEREGEANKAGSSTCQARLMNAGVSFPPRNHAMANTEIISFAMLLSMLAICSFGGAADSAEQRLCKVVLSYECRTKAIYGNVEIEKFVKATLENERKKEGGDISRLSKEALLLQWPDTIYIVDINKDGIPEYIVPVSCGAVGNCRYLLFADHPARVIADFPAQYIIFQPGEGKWPQITTYCHDSAMSGAATIYEYTEAAYNEIASELLVDGLMKDGKMVNTLKPFLKEMGKPVCECHKES